MQQGGCHPVDGCLDGDGFDGADFEFLAANVVSQRDRRHRSSRRTRSSEFDGAQGRLHRHDPRGHAQHRHAVRRRRASTSSTRPTPSTRSCPSCSDAGRRDDRRAAPRGRRRRPTRAARQRLHRHQRPDRRHRRPHRPTRSTLVVSGHTHQAYNCVIDGTPGHQRRVVRPARDRHRPDDRPPHRRRHGDHGRQRHRHAATSPAEPADHRAHRPRTRRCRRRSPTGSSATITADITRDARRRRASRRWAT